MSLSALQIRRELIDLARRYFGPEGSSRKSRKPRRRRVDGSEKIWMFPDLSHEPSTLAQWCELHEQIGSLPGPRARGDGPVVLRWVEPSRSREHARRVGSHRATSMAPARCSCFTSRLVISGQRAVSGSEQWLNPSNSPTSSFAGRNSASKARQSIGRAGCVRIAPSLPANSSVASALIGKDGVRAGRRTEQATVCRLAIGI